MATLFSTSVDGTRIAYDVAGHGPALMLLHGAGKTRRDWHKAGYVERLKDDFTVITVDIRGAGDSDCMYDIADYGIEKICEDLYAVADDCGASKFAVWGFSFGGSIARYLGAWSDRVTAIAVIGVPFGPAVHEEFDRFIDQFLKKWEDVILAAREGSAPQSKGKIKGQIPALAACFQAMRDWPSVEPGEVACPTLLLTGTKNRSTLDWVEANRGTLAAAGVQIEVVEGLVHDQEFTKIDCVFPVVSAFFRGQG
ncbi:MAG: alpha/beta fold hydrolase [Anaerolineae bacterium]|jgi:pimeloyl-ACP methyl ester carboxylesterase